MNATLTAPAATVTAPAVDPTLARAEFFFDLEMMELSLTIPQATPRAIGSAKY